jgi:hypothetical protein
LIKVVCRLVRDPLSLKIYGLKRMVLWKKLGLGGTRFISLSLIALKWEIKRWNLKEFGDVGARNKANFEELNMLDRIEEGRQLTEEEKVRRSRLSREVEAFILQEEICRRQKLRVR